MSRLGLLAGVVISLAAFGTARSEDRQPLYYQDPDGKPFYAAGPKTTEQGREYLPVFEDGIAAQSSLATAPKPKASGEHRLLYYRNPIGSAGHVAEPQKRFDGDGLSTGLFR
jgi:membrane fusion protein, copper/silver efflux system